ncbi:hypothetical protein BH11PSE13_BH11PSE13_19060 [soil metagenome]
MHAGRSGAAARLEGYSYAFVVYPRVALQNLCFKTERIPAITFFKGERNDEIDRLADPGRPLRATDRQSE